MIKRIVDEFVLEKFAFKKTISVNEFLDFLYIPKNLRKKLFNEKRILIEKENVSELCEVSELKEKEVYDLKHELIVSDTKADTATKELNEALEKIKNLEKEIIKLQTELKK